MVEFVAPVLSASADGGKAAGVPASSCAAASAAGAM